MHFEDDVSKYSLVSNYLKQNFTVDIKWLRVTMRCGVYGLLLTGTAL